MQHLLLLQEKLNRLLKTFSEMETEKHKLQKIIENQQDVIQKQEEKIERLEKKMDLNSLKQIAEDLSEEKKVQLQKELDRVIAAIEKNISLLK